MTRYEQVRDTLAEALAPVAAYVERAHATIDVSDPKQAGRARHVTQIETLIEAVADFGEVVDARMSAPPAPQRIPGPPINTAALLARCQRHLSKPHMQARARLPLLQRQGMALLTSHDLPVPTDARTV